MSLPKIGYIEILPAVISAMCEGTQKYRQDRLDWCYKTFMAREVGYTYEEHPFLKWISFGKISKMVTQTKEEAQIRWEKGWSEFEDRHCPFRRYIYWSPKELMEHRSSNWYDQVKRIKQIAEDEKTNPKVAIYVDIDLWHFIVKNRNFEAPDTDKEWE